MADFRPFRALRYRPDVAGDLAALISPPYDVIDAAEQTSLHQRSPYNIIRLELSEARSDDNERSNRYTRAAGALAQWRSTGALARDPAPAFYRYVQEFTHDGRRYRRTHLFGLLRLEPWETGAVRPHEHTMAGPKQDRLHLLRALRTNVSPVFVVQRGADWRDAPEGQPLVDATTSDGQRHTLSAITQPDQLERLSTGMRDAPCYILDGHHRFETALAYRDECRVRAPSWSGEEPENFVLAAMTTSDDPGLLCLATHRLVRPPALPDDIVARLQRYFQVDDTTPKSFDGTALHRLVARLAAAGASGTAFGALGLEEGRLHLLTLRDAAAARALMPAHSAVWQSLDVNVLEYAVLRDALGVQHDTPGAIEYTDSAPRALRAVETGRWPLAFLLNATKVSQMMAVADAGERMPPKSTYFYPKLATGLVLYALEP